MADDERWPSLPLAAWKDTYATLHMWTQIVGKIRLALTPWINHSWHVTLYVTARGLTTSPMAFGLRTFQIGFDFIDHRVLVQTDDGAVETVALRPRSVADFHDELFAKLRGLGIDVRINTTPNEVVDATPFERDRLHAAYDAAYARRCWRALVQAHRVLTVFRAEFLGKCSPVHFFWGSFDLAVTRFSGRTAPPHPGGVPHLPDRVAREAYSHEVASCGFWPGNDAVPCPAFYAYAYPEPPGYADARVGPAGARYDGTLHEFVLPYDDVRSAADPDATLLQFCRTTYAAAADLGRWHRAALERTSSR
jgi:hypothetical protein